MPKLEALSSIPGHSEPAWSVAFNPTRSLLASCSTDRTVRLYSYTLPSSTSTKINTNTTSSSTIAPSTLIADSNSPAPIFSFLSTIQTEHKRTVRSIAWAPSGRTLATGSFDSSVAIWEEDDGEDGDADEDEDQSTDRKSGPDGGEGGGKNSGEWECVTVLEGHDSECKSVGFSSDGTLLASCSRDKSVWVWEDVKCLAWHPKEEILASASYDSHIHLMFDDPDGDWTVFQKLHAKLPAEDLIIPRTENLTEVILAMSPASGVGESESQSGGTSGAGVQVPPLEEAETVWSLAWSPCGRFLASAGDCGGIRIWSRTGSNPDSLFTEVLHTSAHSRACLSLSWAVPPNNTDSSSLGLLVSGGGDGRIIVWDVREVEGGVVESRAHKQDHDNDKDHGHDSDHDHDHDHDHHDHDHAHSHSHRHGHASRSTPRVSLRPIAATHHAHGVFDVNCVTWCQRTDARGKVAAAGLLASAGDDGSVKVWRVVL